jgi:3-oxoacid CoA-transferase subunit A
MAIKKFIVSGDCHGDVETRIKNIMRNLMPPIGLDISEIAVIILGDVGLNFYLNKTDEKKKKILANYGIRIYCVRGNHEERPENLNFQTIYDDDVMGEVYIDPINSEIRYFLDGEAYNIEGYRCLVIGGAYSVDKWYRLERAGLTEKTNNPKLSGWFADEQISDWEAQAIAYHHFGQEYDFILTHTCPLSWEPTDLFLGFIDQSKVDKSMEQFLDQVKDEVKWNIWCFGHYHADRLERPHVEQFYYRYDWLSEIYERWTNPNKAKEILFNFTRSPNFYMT